MLDVADGLANEKVMVATVSLFAELLHHLREGTYFGFAETGFQPDSRVEALICLSLLCSASRTHEENAVFIHDFLTNQVYQFT